MKSSELAAQVTEGANLLAVFLCTETLRALRARGTTSEVTVLLGEALVKYGPAFRAMQRLVHGAKDVEPALTRMHALVRFGLDFDSPAHLADLRGAIRELLGNLGFDLPHFPKKRGITCELHGKRCPAAPAGT